MFVAGVAVSVASVVLLKPFGIKGRSARRPASRERPSTTPGVSPDVAALATLDPVAQQIILRAELEELETALKGDFTKLEAKQALRRAHKKIEKFCSVGASGALAFLGKSEGVLNSLPSKVRLEEELRAEFRHGLGAVLAPLRATPPPAEVAAVSRLETWMATDGKLMVEVKDVESRAACQKMGDILFASLGTKRIAFLRKTSGPRLPASERKIACYYQFGNRENPWIGIVRYGKDELARTTIADAASPGK